MAPAEHVRVDGTSASRTALCVWAALAGLRACGPGSSAEIGDASDGAETTASASTGVGTSGASLASDSYPATSGEPPFCNEVVDGDLRVRTLEDVARARHVVSVTGEVSVMFENLDDVADAPSDLSFLGCLESARLLTLWSSPSLVSTTGPGLLRELDLLRISRCESLQSVTGFDSLEHIGYLDVESLPSLETINLPSVRSIDVFHLGECPGNPPMPGHNSSLEVDGAFDALEYLRSMNVGGNLGLRHITLLDALATNGGDPPDGIGIVHNPMLSEAEVIAQVEALGGSTLGICGNLGTLVPLEECICPSPD